MNAALTGTVLLQFVATCALAGIAWNEAVMHIPLLVRVGRGRFRRYDSARRVLQPLLSMPLMAIESATALAGAWMAGTPLHLAGVLLLIAIWAMTFGPHRRAARTLSREFVPSALRSLLCVQWVRAMCWSLRVVVLVLVLVGGAKM